MIEFGIECLMTIVCISTSQNSTKSGLLKPILGIQVYYSELAITTEEIHKVHFIFVNLNFICYTYKLHQTVP